MLPSSCSFIIDTDNRQTEQSNEYESSVITSELLSRLRSGSEAAFKTVYLHYYRSLERFVFSLLRSKKEAEDVAQDIFMSIWNKREQIDPQKNIHSFISDISVNAVMNKINHA